MYFNEYNPLHATKTNISLIGRIKIGQVWNYDDHLNLKNVIIIYRSTRVVYARIVVLAHSCFRVRLPFTAIVRLTEPVYLFAVEFRSKVACENEVVNLQCNPNSRLAMYSASYGRTEYESIQCPQPQGVPEESE